MATSVQEVLNKRGTEVADASVLPIYELLNVGTSILGSSALPPQAERQERGRGYPYSVRHDQCQSPDRTSAKDGGGFIFTSVWGVLARPALSRFFQGVFQSADLTTTNLGPIWVQLLPKTGEQEAKRRRADLSETTT